LVNLYTSELTGTSHAKPSNLTNENQDKQQKRQKIIVQNI